MEGGLAIVLGPLFLYSYYVDLTIYFTITVASFGIYMLWRTSERYKRRRTIQALRELRKINQWKAEELYLKTPYWRAKRKEAFAYFGNRCAGCNSPFNLEGHHRTYANLFDERRGDVVPFCGSCHRVLPKSKDLYTGNSSRY
jgi:hypothetical protein